MASRRQQAPAGITRGAALPGLMLLLGACAGSGEHGTVEILPPLVIESLGRERILRVYLPPGYDESGRRYPVVYMHDGQNLFDDATSFMGEWGVDETLDELARTDGIELVVVGIDHGGESRINELGPWTPAEYAPAEGKAYMQFVVETVKPFIDARYRTLPGREHTAIAGSSLGGLVSHYALLSYPEVFSKAGVFSPAYWFAPEIFPLTRERPPPPGSRLYLVIGGLEGDGVGDMQAMCGELADVGHPPEALVCETVPGGEHNEDFWRAEFADAIRWLFARR